MKTHLLLLLLSTSSLFSNQILPETMMSDAVLSDQNAWLPYVKKIADTSGQIETKDALGTPIILEWKKTTILSPELATFKQAVCTLASDELASVEVQFLRAHPEAASQELFLKSCAPLLENGVDTVDWQAVKENVQATISQFYLADLSKFGPERLKPLMDDVYFCVSVKNKNDNQLLGFLTFAVTPALPLGTIKVINLVVRSRESHRGLEKALMHSILTLIPRTEKLFLFVRPTDAKAMQTYHSLGFTKDAQLFQDPNHPVNTKYLTPLEYHTLKVKKG